MATRPVQNTLYLPGTDQPLIGRRVSIRLNVSSVWTDDGAVEKIRTRYTTTDDTGMWSVELDVNDDIDPPDTWYTVREATEPTLAFQVPAGDPDVAVNLRDCLITDPTNPDPVIVPPAVTSVNGEVGTVVLDASDVGAATPTDVANAQAAAVGLADSYTDAQILAERVIRVAAEAAVQSAAAADATAKVAAEAAARSTAITTALNNLVAGAPAALDTLDELAAALGDNASYAASITTALAGKAALDGNGLVSVAQVQTAEVAYAENVSAVNIVAGNNVQTDLFCTITVPPDPRVLWLEADCAWQITAAGAGGLYLSVFDITGGSPGTLLAGFSGGARDVLAANSGTWTLFPASMPWRKRLGPVTSTKVYALFCMLERDSASSLAAKVRNIASNPTYLMAVAR